MGRKEKERLNSKPSPAADLQKAMLEKELAKMVTGIISSGTFTEVVNILDAIYSHSIDQPQLVSSDLKLNLNLVSSIKLWNHHVTLRFHLLKMIGDQVSDKDKFAQISDDVRTQCGLCFDILLELPNKLASSKSNVDEKKTSELYARLSQYACNMGFRFQKRQLFEDALNWCDRATQAYYLWKSSGSTVELKMNIQWLALLKAECLRLLGKSEEGLRWLTKMMKVEPSLLKPSVCYDVYEQIPWAEFSTHWITLYKEMWTFQPEFNKTALDFMEEEEPGSLSQELISKVLRVELNSHFSGRHGIPSGLIAVGEALMEKSSCPFDNALGYLGRAIGYSWGSPEQVEFAVGLIHEAVLFIDNTPYFKKERNMDIAAFLYGLVGIWRGVCLIKSQQYFVEAEMEILKQQFMTENPEKYKDRDTGEELRGVSGFSKLNLDHEADWVGSLVQGTEVFFRFAQAEEVLYKISEEFCPALLVISLRLSAGLLTAVGFPTHAVKAWHVLNKLAKIYDRKGLMVLSASEILKVIPDMECEAVTLAEFANETAIAEKSIKHNKAISYRIWLAKSIACYNLKLYAEGVAHLLKVFDFFNIKDNYDSSHHLLGEATYVLSLYRTIQFSHEIDLSEFPLALREMSPSGIAVKGYKTLGGMTREIDIMNSGWTDLIHNYFILGSIMNIGTYTMKVLRDSGKAKELKCFLSDAVNFAQHCALVSRSISLVVPMIDHDISARNFLQAQMKIDAINRTLKSSSCPGLPGDGNVETYQKIMDNIKLPNLTLQRVECEMDLKWTLKSLDIPSLYYRNRSEKMASAIKKDLREGFDTQQFCFPTWMRHSLSCPCYICLHPLILPTAFNFFHIQAKYLNCMSKAKAAIAVLETTKLCHERAIFRLIYHLSILNIPLTVIASTRKLAFKAVEFIYTPYCVEPGIDALLTQMTLCPASDIKMILNAMKKAILIIETLDPKDYIGKSFPLELGLAALHQYFITTGDVKINGSEIREILEQKLRSQEKENRQISKTPPLSPTQAKPTVIKQPPRVHKKGILKASSTKSAKQDVILDDRPISHLPILKFDIDVEELEDSVGNSGQSENLNGLNANSTSTRDQKVAQQQLQRALRSNVTERRPRRGRTDRHSSS